MPYQLQQLQYSVEIRRYRKVSGKTSEATQREGCKVVYGNKENKTRSTKVTTSLRCFTLRFHNVNVNMKTVTETVAVKNVIVRSV
jgi:hypothetical protein